MKIFEFKDYFKLFYRPGTTDEKVIDEVLKRNVYQRKKLDFVIESGDVWMDCGANIGTFSLLCLHKGAEVYAFEPEPSNFSILNDNMRINNYSASTFLQAVHLENRKGNLFLCKGDYNKYRHSLVPRRGRSQIEVDVKSISSILKKFPINCIKMDIEGSEIEILEKMPVGDLKRIDKIVFEYSFDFDKSIPRFIRIIDRLRTIFSMVHYDKVNPNELEYNYFPASALVFCKK